MPLVARNPATRDEIHRSRVYTRVECIHCGGFNLTPSGKHSYLYRYTLVPDGDRGGAVSLPGLLCSDDCYRGYHMEEMHSVAAKSA